MCELQPATEGWRGGRSPAQEKNKEKRKKGYFLNVIAVLIINIMFAEWNKQLAMHSSEFYIVAKLRNYSA